MIAKTIKATVRCSGRVIEVFQQKDKFIDVDQGTEWKADELDFAKDIDWQHYRIQFVGQIASAVMSNYEFYVPAIAEECKKSGKSRPEMVAQMSVEIADALIAELKKGGEE